MKKTLLFAVLSMFMAGTAQAGILDIYTGITMGGGENIILVPSDTPNLEDITKSTSSFGAVVGVDIPLFRFEAEYNYLTGDSLDLHLGMINGYVKFFPLPIVKPYLGLGVGSVIEGKIKDAGDIKNATVAQAMLGLQFDIPAFPIFIDLEGRALYAKDIYTFSTPIGDKDLDLLQYEVRAKLRYVF